MHKHFGEWYRLVAPDPRHETVDARWKAVVEQSSALDFSLALDLLRLFWGIHAKESLLQEQLSALFQKHDASFPMKKNSAELRLLAGSMVIVAIEGDHLSLDQRILLALAMGTTSYLPSRRRNHLPDAVIAAENFLQQKALEVRSANEKVSGEAVRTSLNTLKQAFKTGLAVTGMDQQLDAFGKSIAETLEQLAHRNDRVQEEVNILWWLTNGYSRSLDSRFSDIDISALVLAGSSDIAGLMVISPSPSGMKEFLSSMLKRAGASRKTISVAEAIEALPQSWKEAWLKSLPTESGLDLCPISLCIKTNLEIKKMRQWRTAAESKTGVTLAQKVGALEVAQQFFNECLLLRGMVEH